MEELDIVKIVVNPSFSSISRVGWEGIIIQRKDEQNEYYLSVTDKLGVSWPLLEYEVELVKHLELK